MGFCCVGVSIVSKLSRPIDSNPDILTDFCLQLVPHQQLQHENLGPSPFLAQTPTVFSSVVLPSVNLTSGDSFICPGSFSAMSEVEGHYSLTMGLPTQ